MTIVPRHKIECRFINDLATCSRLMELRSVIKERNSIPVGEIGHRWKLNNELKHTFRIGPWNALTCR
jgi:hypothetical protein